MISEPVTDLRHAPSGYEARTPHYRATAHRLVIAVNAAAPKSITGDIVETIVASPQYQQLIGVAVVTVTQWWPTAWWPTAFPGKDVRRIWTTDHCLNFMEIPVDQYGGQSLATRTVYSDEMSCVALWQQLNTVSRQAVEAEIDRELHAIFPQGKIPTPLHTYVQVWPDAWYWQKAGSPFSNAAIAQWATEPLPGEAVSLVGESYNPQRSSWSDGAYKSSIATLNRHFGLMLPTTAPVSPCQSAMPRSGRALDVQRARHAPTQKRPGLGRRNPRHQMRLHNP